MDTSARAALVGAVLVVGCSGRGGGPSEAVRPLAPVTGGTGVQARSCRAPIGLDVVPTGDGRSGSTVVMARVHGRLLAYAADEDARAVRILDAEAPAELASVGMPGRPARMVMLPGGRLAVTLRDQAKVALFTPSAVGDTGLDPLCTLDTPDEPVDLAVKDGDTLLALSNWGHAVTAFDLETGAPRFSVDLARSPRALLVSADGAHAYVAHAAGRAMTTVDLRAPAPSAEDVDLRGRSFERAFFEVMPMPPIAFDFNDEAERPHPRHHRTLGRPPPPLTARERSACQGFALAELAGDRPRVFAPMVEVATGDLTVPSAGYGAGSETTTAELPVIGVLDETTGKPVPDSLVAHEGGASGAKPCLLPRAAAASAGSLFVACMGIDALVEYDASHGPGGTSEKRRWAVGAGPTGVAIHGRRAVVWSEFDGEATFVSLDADAKTARVVVRRAPRDADGETLALGRALFHKTSDPRISGDGRACASCHPDGRDDGLVWSTPGGPRQTPMLAGRLPDTAPYGWDGSGRDVPGHLAHTLARLEGEGLPPRELAALVRYITTLDGPPVHAARAATREGQLARGRDVFYSAGCGSCHAPESAFTDGDRHDVKSRVMADEAGSFDTPSLRFVVGTAPYFHDGRFPTLRALLATKDGPMGAARDRSPEDLDALEAFVRSL